MAFYRTVIATYRPVVAYCRTVVACYRTVVAWLTHENAETRGKLLTANGVINDTARGILRRDQAEPPGKAAGQNGA